MAFTLPRLPSGDFTPVQLQIWWQQVVEAIEAQENAQNDQIAAITELQTEQAAQLDQIIAAQAAATAAAREAARLTSYPNPGSILSAKDAGDGTATITIAAHTRVYPVQGTIAVPPVTFTNLPHDIPGLAYSTRYYVYYDDTTLANPAPAFIATTVSATAQVGAAPGRHFVGFVDTPASGGTTTSGSGGSPPGGGGGGGTIGGYIP